MKRTVAILFVLASGAAVVAAERPHFDSHSVDGPIRIDGNFDDWTGNAGGLEPFGKDALAIQALNDGTFLYLRLSASDPGVRSQIVRRGLTIWFDPKGGTKKTFGIRYPVIENPGGDDERGAYRGIGGYGGHRRPTGEGGSPGAARDDSEQPPDRVDIVGPGKDDEVSLTREHLQGVDVAFTTVQGVLQYELKVPLARSSDLPYAVGAAPSATIGIGLETPKPVQRSFGGEAGGGEPGGGFGGGGFGGGGFGGGGFGRGGFGRGGGHRGGGEREFQPPKPLKGWGTLTLK